jgi:hypothetical protein
MSDTSTLWKAILPDGSLVDPGTAGTLKFDNTVAGDAAQTDHQVGGSLQLDDVVDNPMYTTDPTSNSLYGQKSQTFESLTADTGITVPTILKALALFPVDTQHGGDYIYIRNYGERLPYRGGSWRYGGYAGVFALSLINHRSIAGHSLGFRSAFVA